MRQKVLSALVVGALGIAPALYAQDNPPQTRNPHEQQADRSGHEILTGCLTEEQGTYKLSTGSGEQIDVSGPASLSKHKNHTVKLTGTASNEGGKRMLTVSKIEHVSPSCSK